MKCLLCNRQLRFKLTIKDVLWPVQVVKPIICPECSQRFGSLFGQATCPVCSRPQQIRDICNDCKEWRKRYSWKLQHHALYRYDDAMKEFMQRYKFAGDYRLRQVFTTEFTSAIKSYQADLVVPIPVTEHTMKTRGFNQVEGLLGNYPVSKILGCQHSEKTAQSLKNRRQRLTTAQPFKLLDPAVVAGKNALLVDDIYTTGRTIYHAASLLYDAGATSVISISLAR